MENNWIKVTEKMPICDKKPFWDDEEDECIWKTSDNVLVVVKNLKTNNKYITFGMYYEIPPKFWLIGEDLDSINSEKEEVTHWMPMPELPKASI